MSDTSLLTAGFELKRKIVHAETESTDLLKPGLPLFAAVPFEFIDDLAVSDAYARAVYMVLRRYSDFANGDHAFPSVKTIAKNVHCSERKVQQSIGQLVQTGWLSVKRKGGRGLSNEYQLSLRKGCIQCTLSKLPTKRVHVVPKKGAPGAVYLDTLTKRHIAPSAPSVTSKPKKKKSPPIEGYSEFVKTLRELHKKTTGAEYMFGDREGAQVKRLLHSLKTDVALAKLRNYYGPKPLWFTKGGCYSLQNFEANVNAIPTGLNGSGPPKVRPRCPKCDTELIGGVCPNLICYAEVPA